MAAMGIAGGNETRTLWRFAVASLALWRATNLLAEEDGSWKSIARVRASLAGTAAGRVIHCFYCLSLWVALPVAILLSDGWIGLFVQWPALSGAARLFHRVTALPVEPHTGTQWIRIETIE
jgi:alkylhydroperoxidase family enzyme